MWCSHVRRGITLVEVLIVIFIIVLLMCLFLSQTVDSREAARRASCINNMKQLGLALHNYHSVQNTFPGSNDVQLLDTPSSSWAQVPLHTPAEPDPSVGPLEYGTNFSWLTQILPHIEATTVHQWVDMTNHRAWDPCNDNLIDPATKTPTDPQKPCHLFVWSTPMSAYRCPSFEGETNRRLYCQANQAIGIKTNPYAPGTDHGPAAITNYVALGATHSDSLMGVETNPLAGGPDHPNGTIFPGSKLSIHDLLGGDGLTNTIFACETREPTLAAWYEGSTAAVFGLAGHPTFEQTKEPGNSYGVPAKGTKTTLNLGNEASNPVAYYLMSGPQGIAWLHGPSSFHPGVVNHLFGDGSVRSIQEDLSPTIYMHFITRKGHDPHQIIDYY